MMTGCRQLATFSKDCIRKLNNALDHDLIIVTKCMLTTIIICS